MDEIAGIRKEYKLQSLDEKDVLEDPFGQFKKWWDEVLQSNIEEPNAMTLATAAANGQPSARIVLLKGLTEKGFLFFTNYESHKATELQSNPQACLVFFWKELERQVRVQGTVAKITATESDEYFKSRPMASQIGAWASPQSTVIGSRKILEENVTAIENKFSGTGIQRPKHWGGYILTPFLFEFWQGRRSRLHDRIQFTQEKDQGWKIERLAP
jgi:pyridoxamine 5'-phosphate oxidase